MIRRLLIFTFLHWCAVIAIAQTVDEIVALGLPVLVISTENSEEPSYDVAYSADSSLCTISNAKKVPGSMYIVKDGEIIYSTGTYNQDKSGLTIKVRGNSSAVNPAKKPYKIKLEKKADLLLRGDNAKYKDKDWILIKDSKRKMNTLLGMKVNEMCGLPYAQQGELVNVFLNGIYRGIYVLAEAEERNPECRVDISEDGYLFEADAYWWSEATQFRTTIASRTCFGFTFKYPDSDDITDEQVDYLHNWLSQFEDSLLSGGDYTKYIDVDSWALWLLAHDILGTNDWAGSNIFFAKYDRSVSSKIIMPNLWDYDTVMLTEGKWARIHECYFYFKLLMDSPCNAFRLAYINNWKRINASVFNKMDEYIDTWTDSEYAYAVNNSKRLDAAKWHYTYSTVEEDANEAHLWLSERHKWMSQQIDSMLTAEFPYTIPDMNVTTVHSGAYNLLGQKLQMPLRGINIIDGKKVWITR